MAEIIDTLNDLIASCLDSAEGFGKAAKGVHEQTLRDRFLGIARRRQDFAEELARLVEEMGGTSARQGHQSGIQHRGWRELEEGVRPRDSAAFLADCETGEENTLRHYEQALTRNLPAKTRAVVERQRLAVQETLLELRSVEQTRRAG